MLGRLVIKGCPNLSEVPLVPLCLRVLTVHDCPKLMQLPPVSSRLEELDLENCGGGVETMLSNMLLLCNDGENGSSSSSSIQGVGFVVLRRLRIVRSSSIHHGGENEKELCLDKLLMSTSLTHLELTELPWLTSALLGPNLTALEHVTIEKCENLRSIGNSLVSSSLKSLDISDCPRLTVQQQPDDHWGGVMYSLCVRGCPELTWLWNLNCFTSVRVLAVMGCPKLTLIKSRGGGGGDDSLSPMPSSSSSALERVTIDDLSLLTAALPRRECCLNSLRHLTIVRGSNKEEKPLTAEQEELFQHHLTSLTMLYFLLCEGLPSLPANLENLSSLKHMEIWDCPKIESLPNLPASLKRVEIHGGCHPRLKEQYRNHKNIIFLDF
ncbi:putative disease resistance protein RGA2-like [Iris pallida]|uniref:Disease resistance protein RGA2-like n=1 Tax=Iris pallida TaxID=29817 RepID=A0AAX6G737_IRIPA|nr:putative disease resistance protein RGA2-like [Iris pallida]